MNASVTNSLHIRLLEQSWRLRSPGRICRYRIPPSHPELQTSSHPEHVCFGEPGRARACLVRILGQTGFLRFRPNLVRWFCSAVPGQEGSGPANVALHESSRFLTLSHPLRGAVAVHRYDAARGLVGVQLECVPGTEVYLHPGGSLLAIQDGPTLQLHRWSAHDGQSLRAVHVEHRVQPAQLQATSFATGSAIRCGAWSFPVAASDVWQPVRGCAPWYGLSGRFIDRGTWPKPGNDCRHLLSWNGD